ncbi:MAG: hypothetical protein ACREN8_06085, partial [Candidatus Dormibacteraceae bacterium]
KRAWFGPKRVGWGLTPIAWQGWLVTAIFGLAVLALMLFTHASSKGVIGTILMVVAFIAIALLTGKPPGHRS